MFPSPFKNACGLSNILVLELEKKQENNEYLGMEGGHSDQGHGGTAAICDVTVDRWPEVRLSVYIFL